MKNLNKVMLIGHLGKDPEVKYLDGNNVVANFTVATTESYTGKDGNRVDQTEWHNVVAWRKLAEICEKFLKKGSFVYLEGSIRTRSWEDKDGNKKYTTEILAQDLVLLDKKESSGSSNSGATNTPERSSAPRPVANEPSSSFSNDEPDDDLPF
jgi:single-strand DNA-binding protein